MGAKTTSQNQNQFQIQNQTTQSAPWAVAQPGLERSLGLANTAADTTYNGSSVAALDPLVTQGQNANLAAATANQPGQMANSFVNAYQPLLANGGVSALGLEGVGNLNQAASYLNPYASGSYVNSGNPYLDAVIAKNDAATMGRINSNFSSAGRYGSPAQAGTAANAIQAADNATRATQYNTDADRQLQAIQGLGNIGQAKAGIGQTGVGNINSYISALPTIAQGNLWQGNTIQSIGGQNMDYLQRVINAANQDPWTKAQNLAQISGGIGQLGGTSSSQGISYGQGTTTKKEDPGVFGDILAGVGAATNLASAVAGVPSVGTSFGSFGQKASDLFSPPTFQGLYGSPFGGIGSDIRIKDNIKELATLDNGLKLYSFTYKSGGPPQIGFMAQEVEKLYPEAVTEDKDGIKYVYYDILATRFADA
jgi:hypothetical protein